jgi:hypothetical protein
MKNTFRQGIIRFQSDINNQPQYLTKSALNGTYVDLNVSPDPCIITFAHGNSNYTIQEIKYVNNAWGPFQPLGMTQYLYWDIDTLTGLLSRNYTLIPPVTSSIAPVLPEINTHWFDADSTTMKVWNGVSWVTKIRVFAGIYDSNAILIHKSLGSQVGLEVACETGTILFDDMLKPLRTNDFTFMTTETNLHISSASNNPASSIKFESLLNYVKASEYIPAYSVVSFVATSDAEPGSVMLGRYTNTSSQVHGVVVEDMFLGDVALLIRSGIIQNEQWNFNSVDIGKPLFCGITGEITIVPPQIGVVQIIGNIDSNKSINVNIQSPTYY